jgi:hypothetical protein
METPPNCLLVHLKRFHVYSQMTANGMEFSKVIIDNLPAIFIPSLEVNDLTLTPSYWRQVDTMVHFPTRDLDIGPFLSTGDEICYFVE